MASVKSQTQREVESDIRLGGEECRLHGTAGLLGPPGLPGPGPDLAFGDQATARGVSLLRCI
jgi:hypothetical protein